jgi:hypothetical protein
MSKNSPERSPDLPLATLVLAIREWNRAASDLRAAVTACLQSSPAVADALAERLEANQELDESYPRWEKVIDLRKVYDKAEQALLAALEPVKTEYPEFVEHLKTATESTRSLNRTIRAAADYVLANQGIDVAVGMGAALATDPSGRRADDFSRRVAKASDYAVAERLSGENRTSPRGKEAAAMHHIRVGMYRLVLKHRVAFDLLAKKRRGYLKAAIEQNALDDVTRGLIFADHDRLELTMKGEQRRKKVEPDGEAQCSQPGAGHSHLEKMEGEQLQVLLVAEREAERQAIVARFRDQLPPKQKAIFDLRRQGVREADALRQLGLPQSQGNALRNRINRLKEELRREAA